MNCNVINCGLFIVQCILYLFIYHYYYDYIFLNKNQVKRLSRTDSGQKEDVPKVPYCIQYITCIICIVQVSNIDMVIGLFILAIDAWF